MDKADFIRAICAEPADDTVRLAYADWLDARDTHRTPCPSCTPYANDACPHCHGQKHVTYFKGPGATNPNWKDCPECKATGTFPIGYYPARDPASGREEGGWTNCKTCNGGGGPITPGLVLDTSDADRAEFIRIQIELQKYQKETAWLEQMPVEQWKGDPEEGELLRRLAPLVKRHLALCKQYVRSCATWSREFARSLLGDDWLNRSATWQWYWCRGFVQEIELPLESFVRCAKDIFSGQPIQRVKLTGVVRGDIVFRTSNGHTNDIAKEIWEELGIPKCTSKVNDCWQRGTHAHMTEDDLSTYLVAYGRRLAELPPLT